MSEHVGTLLVSAVLLERLLSFPDGMTIVGASFVKHVGLIGFTVASDALPETPDGYELPRVDLIATLEQHPLDPTFRRVTTELRLP